MSNSPPPPAVLQSPPHRHESIWREQPPSFYDYDPAAESPQYGTGQMRPNYSPPGNRARYRSAPMTPSYSYHQQDYYEYWQHSSPHDSPLPQPPHYHWSNPTHSPESNPWSPPPYDYDGSKTMPPPVHRGYFSPPGTPGTPGSADHLHLAHLSERSKDELPPADDADLNQAKNNGDGDPLRILASVSADMTEDEKRMKANPQPIPAPTSPLQRRGRGDPDSVPNVATPKQRPARRQITPSSTRKRQTTKKVKSRSAGSMSTRSQREHVQGDDESSQISPKQRPRSSAKEESPALVERSSSSFESDQGERQYPLLSPPSRDYNNSFYDDRPPPTFRYQAPPYAYWSEAPHAHVHTAPPPPPLNLSSRSPYIPPRWSYDHSMPPPPYQYPRSGPEPSRPSPPSVSAPQTPYRPYPFPSHHAAPYTYVQQPRLEEKTILRKKFSWKHYPEVCQI
jgi:hypothetical protein